jgi:hypothetical protein
VNVELLESLGVVHVPAGRGCEEKGPHRPDVGSLVDLRRASQCLLRRHERRRATRDPTRDRGVATRESSRDAEIEQAHGAVEQQVDVVWFYVAMDDSLAVRRREHVENVERNRYGLRRRELPAEALTTLTQALAREQRQDEERTAILGHVLVENMDRRRVLHLVRKPRLA